MLMRCHHLQVSYISSSPSEIWNTDCVFEKGKNYHIKAPSGKGKSTFMACLYGLLKEYSGDVFLDENSLKKLSIDEVCEIREKKVSIVFQDLKLFEYHSALDNIELKRQQTNHYATNDIVKMSQRLGIEHTLNRPIHSLSYGERQRVAIIRALMQPFDYLLLDEPFSHLDNVNTDKVSALILEEVQKRNASIILADLEHDSLFPYHKSLNL